MDKVNPSQSNATDLARFTIVAKLRMTWSCLTNILRELGLMSLYNSNRNVKILCAQRFVRLFAYGSSTLILASYLSISGHSDDSIGLFMTLTILGDVLISFFLALFADAIGRRFVLAVGAVGMIGSGTVFGLTGNYWALLAAAVVGVISASGSDIGPFRALEASILAHLVNVTDRGYVFAWYALFGSAGAAFGQATCGLVTAHLHQMGWSLLDAYRFVFFGYACVGAAKLLLVCCLNNAVELEIPSPSSTEQQEEESEGSEVAPLLPDQSAGTESRRRRLLPLLSPETKRNTFILSVLFGMDALGSGLAPLSWITYFFKRKFNLAGDTLGMIFFVSSMIAAFSQLGAAAFARRVGNVHAMVLTHLPSSISLAILPFPNQLPLATSLLFFRASTQSMDNAPRSAFLADILQPSERTAVLGFFNVVGTISQAVGPSVTGFLSFRNLFWVAFVLAGGMKFLYDIGLLGMHRYMLSLGNSVRA